MKASTDQFVANRILLVLILICLLPLPESFLGIGHVSIYKKPVMLLTLGSILFWSQKEYHIRVLEGSLLLLILYQILSIGWTFSIHATISGIMDHLFLLILLFVFTAHHKQKSYSISRVVLLFQILLVVAILVFWLSELFTEDGLSLTDYIDINRYLGNNTNYLGSVLAMSFAFYPIILQERKINKGWVIALMCLHILVLTSLNSRLSLILALVIGLVQLLVTQSKRRLFLQVLGFLGLFAGILFLVSLLFQDPQSFLEEINPMRFNGARLQMWNITWHHLFLEHPILGNGTNTWHLLFPNTDLSIFSFSMFHTRFFTHAHNLLVERLSDWGTLGILFFLIFTLWPLYQFCKIKNKMELLPYFMIYCAYLILALFYGVIYSTNMSFSGPTVLWIFAMSKINAAYGMEGIPEKSMWMIPKWTLASLLWICLAFYGLKIYQHNQYKGFQTKLAQGDPILAEKKLLRTYHPYLFPNYFGTRNAAELISRYYNKQDPSTSTYWIEKAVSDQPYNPRHLLLQARLKARLKDYDGAKLANQQVIGLNNTIIEAYIHLAEIALTEKDFKSFEKNFEIAKVIIKGLLRSRDLHTGGNYLNQEDEKFWNKIDRFDLTLNHLEKRSKRIFE